jgi:outer membrane biosynthesis protein TonB
VQHPPYVQPPYVVPPQAPAKSGPGIGLFIAMFGILLLLGGAGLWFYTTKMKAPQTATTTVEVAAAPTPSPATPAMPAAPTPVAAPPPSTTPEVIPQNPDFASPTPTAPPKSAQGTPQAPPQSKPANPPPQAAPPPKQAAAPPPAPAGQTSGNLHAAVEVAQYGEVVFENLPQGRMRFTYDHSAWQPTIHRQPNGTQTLIMRSLKAGIQRVCDVQWELVN